PPAPWPGTFTPSSVIDHHALGYQYDDELLFPKAKLPLAYVRVLFGVINDAPGVVIGPDGKPHPVPGPEPWMRLSRADRNDLAALAIHQAAGAMPDKKAAAQTQKLAARVLARERARLLGQKGGKIAAREPGAGYRPAIRLAAKSEAARTMTSRSSWRVRWLVRLARIASAPRMRVVDGAATPDSCRSATTSSFN